MGWNISVYVNIVLEYQYSTFNKKNNLYKNHNIDFLVIFFLFEEIKESTFRNQFLVKKKLITTRKNLQIRLHYRMSSFNKPFFSPQNNSTIKMTSLI